MEDTSIPKVATSSQVVDKTVSVSRLNTSSDSGFRDGNQGPINNDEMWDKTDREYLTRTIIDSGTGLPRGSGSTRQSLQTDDNAIPGSGKNVPPGGGPGTSGGAKPSDSGGPSDKGGGSGSGGGAHGKGAGGGSRHGGDGGDPHPGGSAGGGGHRGAITVASEGTSALLAKMFAEPLKDPVPMATQFLPCDTEELRTEREGDGSFYSPVMWADPLIPCNITVGSTHSAIDKLPAVGCSVSNRIDYVEPQLTETGIMLKTIVESESSPSLLRSMLPVRNMKDASAMISLMETARKSGYQPMTDSAPMIRLGLLMHCLAPVKWMTYVTSNVQNLVANGYADMEKATKTWTTAPAMSTQTEIGVV